MLMIKLLTQLDHSDWRTAPFTVKLQELQIHINKKRCCRHFPQKKTRVEVVM